MFMKKFIQCFVLGLLISSFAEANTDKQFSGLQSGTVIGKHIFGLSRDFQNDPLMVDDNPLIYGTAKKNVELIVDEKKFVISFFDHLFGGIYLSEFNEGNNHLLNTSSLDLGSLGGIFGVGDVVKTDWNTALFSEDRLVDARDSEAFSDLFSPYFKGRTEDIKPYGYGWINEVIVLDKLGKAKAISNYSVGRLQASDILVMPDNKTFYFYDGNHSGNLYVFISEEANSLAKGVLYVYDSSKGLVELGKSSALKIKFKLKKLRFNKVFKSVDSAESCKAKYTLIATVYGKECLQLSKKNKKYAGQFEPIRMAAYLGVQSIGKGVENLSYDFHKNVIILKQNGAFKELALVNDSDFGSAHVIKN